MSCVTHTATSELHVCLQQTSFQASQCVWISEYPANTCSLWLGNGSQSCDHAEHWQRRCSHQPCQLLTKTTATWRTMMIIFFCTLCYKTITQHDSQNSCHYCCILMLCTKPIWPKICCKYLGMLWEGGIDLPFLYWKSHSISGISSVNILDIEFLNCWSSFDPCLCLLIIRWVILYQSLGCWTLQEWAIFLNSCWWVDGSFQMDLPINSGSWKHVQSHGWWGKMWVSTW